MSGPIILPPPIRLRCPSCNENIKLEKRIGRGEEFRCPRCAAILRLPKISMQLFFLSMISFCVGIFSTALIGMALNIKTPHEAIFFQNQSNPIPGIIFWITAILGLILAALSTVKMRLQVVRRASSHSDSSSHRE